MADEILQVRDYSLKIQGANGKVLPVLENISFSLKYGKCLGIAGESGSGKSLLALSIMGLIPQEIIVAKSGEIEFAGKNLLSLDEKELRSLRGRHIAMVFQEPMTAMNPLMTLFEQVAEVIEAHMPGTNQQDIRKRVEETLYLCGFNEPQKFADSYPHQLSGGMRQRAMLAMALVLEPDLLIADEPTTALDAALQVQLLDEFRHLTLKSGRAMIFISHDLGVLRNIANELAILYAGQILEIGETFEILSFPRHPYSRALIDSMPRLIPERRIPHPIKGHIPAPDKKPSGCVFSDRCNRKEQDCTENLPKLTELTPNHKVRCFHPLEK